MTETLMHHLGQATECISLVTVHMLQCRRRGLIWKERVTQVHGSMLNVDNLDLDSQLHSR